MKNKVSDRDYALEEADDYFQDEYDPTEEAYSHYQYHMDMMEKYPIRYRIELFKERVENRWRWNNWRKWSYRVLPWLRNKKYPEEIPF